MHNEKMWHPPHPFEKISYKVENKQNLQKIVKLPGSA
jgi:hypothetical protein